MRASTVALSCVILSFATLATAQDAPRRGPGEGRPPANQPEQRAIPPERARAAWDAQVKTATADMNLEAEKLKALTTAYADQRKAHADAVEQLRRELRERASEADGEGRGREAMAEMQEAIQKLNTDHRANLRKAFAEDLTSGQTDRALESLGTFNMQWDRMVDSLNQFKLDDAKGAKANLAVKDYVVAINKIRESGNRETAREDMQAARTKLTAALKDQLNDEQLAEFERLLAPGRRMEGGPPGERRAPGGRDDGGR